MMADFLLTSGDLDVSTGDLQIVEGGAAVKQELDIRLKFFKGEWFLDAKEGTPWFQRILGQKMVTIPNRINQLTEILLRQIIRKIIVTTPGVSTLDSLETTINGATRAVSITAYGTAKDGTAWEYDSRLPFYVDETED
jgi:hypothetical protein